MSNGGQPEDILAVHLVRSIWRPIPVVHVETYWRSNWRPTCDPPGELLAAHLYTYMRFTWKYPQSTWRPTCGPPGDICDPPGDLPGVHLETYCRPTPPGRLLNGFAQLQRNYFTFMSCKNVYNFSSYQGISYKPLNTPPIPAPLQWRKY